MTTEPPVSLKLPHKTLRQALAELYDARSILANMVRRDFASKHKNNVFGIAWSLLNPLLLVAIYAIAFRFILGVTTTGDFPYPFALYLYSGLVIWNLFATSVTVATSSISMNAFLINRVYIPREVFPISTALSAGVTFLFEFVVLLVFMLIFGVAPGWQILLMPIFPALTILLGIGLGLFVAAIGVRFRDLEHFVGIGFQAWFWATPIIYSLSIIGDRLGPYGTEIMMLNPITPVVVSFRDAVVLARAPEWGWLGYSFAVATVLVATGYWFFQTQEPHFPELL